MDISVFMNWFISNFLHLVTSCFSIMDSIKFRGTTLLRFCVACLILVPCLDILLSLVSESASLSEKSKNSVKGDKNEKTDNNS